MNLIIISSNICCFFFLLLLLFIYGMKKKLQNEENRIYQWILSSNFIVLIVELLFMLAVYYWKENTLLILILEKAYFIYILAWILLFSYYIILISNEKNEPVSRFLHQNHRMNILVLIFLFLLIGGVMVFLPLEHHYRNGIIMYATGAAPTYMSIMACLMVCTAMISVFWNIKRINKRKIIPIFVFVILMSIFYVIYMFYPEVLLISLSITIISHLMYHTIENPDLKMIYQLNYAKNQAEKSNQAKTDFLSSMSHEIRTPLNAIVGFSECIVNEDSLEDAKQDAQDIITASNNLLEIVNGILDISKIEANKMEMVEANYEILPELESIVKLVRPRIGEKPIEFQTKFASDLPKLLYGDRGKIKQIIINLLTNAMKYTEKGMIRFEVNCVNDKNSCSLVISVEDTGRGIKEEKIDHLFDKFNRLEEDRNTTLEGTGLGLAITKQLVEMMGGKIVVQSKYGVGSKFTVYVRQKYGTASSGQTTEVNEAVNVFPGKTVLVVDDNPLNLKITGKLLEKYQITVESVDSGFACLDRIREGKDYDLILLDDMMPKMSGVETLKGLKMISSFSTPCVVLTANALVGMREKYLEAGFDDYLAKPIERKELDHILHVYLGGEKKTATFAPLPDEFYQIDERSEESLKTNEEKEFRKKTEDCEII